MYNFASSRLIDWYIGPDPNVTLPDYNQISTDAFESNDLSGWSSAVTDGGNLSVSSAAAIEGSHGMQATVGGQNELYVRDDKPLNETHYDARFYFDPNSVSIPSAEQLGLFQGADLATGNVLAIRLQNTEEGYQMQAIVYDDSGTPIESSWYPVTDDVHLVEVEWWTASEPDANDGYLSLWLDDSRMEELTGINNDTRRVDFAEMGVLSPSSADIEGTLYFDDFSSNRNGHIGPDENLSLMMAPQSQNKGIARNRAHLVLVLVDSDSKGSKSANLTEASLRHM
jgi:hypothetical protein